MIAIEVHNLAKLYQLGSTVERRYRTLRDAVSRWPGALLGRRREPAPRSEDLWALRDVSFELAEGEALGIMGRNGAGKSTLLKVLSRITEPTSGRARLHGRVASLLEVGTGFHPELTGRENIYFNGALLGMSRAEVRRNFDAIVEFAEIGPFLDTPVKRYSSGMYVRLAFAVAAHLTPEILIVDEVLAVGDHAFQQRCLGRMNEVAHSGRTVLFVSHNMASIEELCPRSLLLSRGQVECMGPTGQVVARYLAGRPGRAAWEFHDHTDREGTGNAHITRLELLAAETGIPLTSVPFRASFRVRLHYRTERRLLGPRFGLALLTETGERIFLSETAEAGCAIEAIDGEGWVDCRVESPNVLPGTYYFEVWITEIANVEFADHLHMVGQVEVAVDHNRNGRVAELTSPHRGRVFIDCRWTPHAGGG